MQRKDYQLIADVFRKEIVNGDIYAKNYYPLLAESLATQLEGDNPRFDRDKFLTACGAK